MFAARIQPNEGLVLVQDKETRLDAAIHMLFMRFNLAVIWTNNENQVVDSVLAHKWALIYQPSAPARYIYEIHPGKLSEFQKGDILALEYE